MKISALIMLMLGIAFGSSGQEVANPENEKLYTPIQFTFITPMGTNGIHSYKYKSTVSLNMLVGVTGGVEGIELGGLSNISLGNIHGVQFAGLSNFNKDRLTGVQGAGLLNVNLGNVNGAQVAGIMNVATKSFTGLQASGILNVVINDMRGPQFSGVMNVATGNIHGGQASGILNFTAKKMTGVQAGLLNYATTLNGFQLGLVNISDSLQSGIPVGLFSFVRKGGYHVVELESNETFFLNANIKTGVKRFYNIFSAGVTARNGQAFMGYGLGFGTMISLTEKLHVDVDFLSKTVFDYEWYSGYEGVHSLAVSASWQLLERIMIYGGPTFNVVVSNKTDAEGNIVESVLAPWSFYNQTGTYSNVQMYPGFKAGIRF